MEIHGIKSLPNSIAVFQTMTMHKCSVETLKNKRK